MEGKKQSTILLTGAAGFIGFHTAKDLLGKGHEVIGIDDFNDYYEVSLKENRAKILEEYPGFKMYRANICNEKEMQKIFEENTIDKICHLAARAGVRYSIQHPLLYEEVNVKGTTLLLEMARNHHIHDFIFASSSSVYGGNTKIPFSESDPVDHPISPYAATKKACELIGHTYHHLYKMNVIGLRFFTVYGPWGRPDMALFQFTKSIVNGEPIEVYNHGKMRRDFTYIDDVVAGVVAALDVEVGYEIFNLGNSHPEELETFIECIEKALGKKAHKKYLPIQPGDVPETYADIAKAKKILGFEPKTRLENGIPQFIKWYREYYEHPS